MAVKLGGAARERQMLSQGWVNARVSHAFSYAAKRAIWAA
jgi:hypothetical protein